MERERDDECTGVRFEWVSKEKEREREARAPAATSHRTHYLSTQGWTREEATAAMVCVCVV
jgi:hypothetical protein